MSNTRYSLQRLKISTRLGLLFGVMVGLSTVLALISLGSQVLVDREISRATDISVRIDRATDRIAENINQSRIILNGYIAQRALGATNDTRPVSDALDMLDDIDDDIDDLRALNASQNSPSLTQLSTELDAFEASLDRMESRVMDIREDLEVLGGYESGLEGQLDESLATLNSAARTTGDLDIQLAALDALNAAHSFLHEGDASYISIFQIHIARFTALVTVHSDITDNDKEILTLLADDVQTDFNALIIRRLSLDTRYVSFTHDADQLTGSLNNIREIGRADFDESFAAIESAQRLALTTRRIMLVMLVTLLVSTLILARGIASGITSRLSSLVAATRGLASGDLSTRAAVSGYDEVAELADSFNEMAVQLEHSVKQTRQASALTSALADTALALTGTLNFDDALDRIIENTSRVIPHDLVAIWLIANDDQIVMHLPTSKGETAPDAALIEPRLLIDDLPLLVRMIRTRKPVVVPQTLEDSEWQGLPPLDWVRSYVGVPIIFQDQVLGILNVYSRDPEFYAGVDLTPLLTFAAQAAVAINNARVYRQLQSHRERLEEAVHDRTRELEAANRHLQGLSRVKDEFVSNVSHELTTPIANSLLHLDLARMRPDKADHHLAIVRRETRRLELIIEDLLQLSRLDQEELELNRHPVNLNQLVSEMYHDRQDLARERGLALDLDMTDDLPPVNGDTGLLGQTLSILLTNALNYTPSQGRVRILTAETQVDGESWAGFAVDDTGPGVPREEQNELFKRFSRGRAGRTTHHPGTGLGLAIAHEIVTRHGGRIELQSPSEGERGAKFSVWLKSTQPPRA